MKKTWIFVVLAGSAFSSAFFSSSVSPVTALIRQAFFAYKKVSFRPC